ENQAPAENPAVDRDSMGTPAPRVAGRPDRLTQRHQLSTLRQVLVELTQVVEDHPRPGHREQRLALGREVAQVPQHAEPEPAARHGAELLLDRLEGLAEVVRILGIQQHGEKSGEPADRTRSIEILAQVVAAMALE